MRVLLLDQFATLGGGQRLLVDVAGAFHSAGWDTQLGLPAKGEVSALLPGIEFVQIPVPVLSIGKKGPADIFKLIRGSMKLASAIRALPQPDVIYVNGVRCLLGAVLSKRANIVSAIHIVHTGAERRLLNRCFRKPQVKAVTFCSSFAASPFGDLSKGEVVENWVSPSILDAPSHRVDSRASLGLIGEQLAVGLLGRISPFKGQSFFCESVESLLPGLDAMLFVAGGVDHEAGISQMPESKERVRFLGKVPDVAAFVDAMDVVAVPSLWEEPFGLVAIEAMARGVPVIATKSGALPEIVEDGRTGLLMEKTADSMRETLSRIAADAPLRRSMGRASREAVELRFSPGPKLDRILRIAARVAGER